MAEARDTSTMEAVDSIGYSKNFTSVMTRKVKYQRVDESNNPEGYSWKIIALTPLYGGAVIRYLSHLLIYISLIYLQMKPLE